jgi:enoyl-CoA hydratase
MMREIGEVLQLCDTDVMMTKESINRAQETALAEGVRFERKLLHAMFATQDQKEGMSAFLQQRSPVFSGR